MAAQGAPKARPERSTPRPDIVELLKVPGRPPLRNALVIVATATIMATLLATSYSLALGRPSPHHIAAGIVAGTPRQSRLATALEQATGGGLAFRRYDTAAAARLAIADQTIYAALVPGPTGPQLLVASASGASVARLLEQVATQVSRRAAGPLEVVDVRPLPAGDPQGLVPFYVTLAATIMGFITMFQLRANAAPLSLRAWLALIALLAAVGGFVLALAVEPIIGALHGPFLELWSILAAEVAVAALVSSTMILLVGRWALIPTWLLFVVLGNASSGGAVAPPLLPTPYDLIGRFLPPGATVEALRNAVYFRGAQQAEPFLVEALWLTCAFVALLMLTRVRGTGPGQPAIHVPRSSELSDGG
jgi:hypothetical protein